jgi:small-conductance mechanosensitive channel
VLNLGENSVDLVLQAFASNADFIEARSRVVEAVRTQLVQHGITIPYPRRDLHVYHRDANGGPLADSLLRGVADAGDLKPRPAPPGP